VNDRDQSRSGAGSCDASNLMATTNQPSLYLIERNRDSNRGLLEIGGRHKSRAKLGWAMLTLGLALVGRSEA